MAKIGFFDSGVGGLSVLKEALKLLPNDEFYYYGDSANCPYGIKGEAFIQNRSFEITEHLVNDYGVEVVVVACNTATSYALSYLRSVFPNVSFLGMVPAVKPAAATTKTNVIGVLATKGTLNASLYKQIRDTYGCGSTIIEHIGEGFVELVESFDISGQHAEQVVEDSIRDMVLAGADKLVLGCSHYPFLKDTIELVANRLKPDSTPNIEVIDPAPAIARHLRSVVKETGFRTSNSGFPNVKLESSGSNVIINQIFQKFCINNFSNV